MALVLAYVLRSSTIEMGISTGPVPAMLKPMIKQSRDPKNVYGLVVGSIYLNIRNLEGENDGHCCSGQKSYGDVSNRV